MSRVFHDEAVKRNARRACIVDMIVIPSYQQREAGFHLPFDSKCHLRHFAKLIRQFHSKVGLYSNLSFILGEFNSLVWGLTCRRVNMVASLSLSVRIPFRRGSHFVHQSGCLLQWVSC